MAINLSTEAAAAGLYPSLRFNKRERKLLESVKSYVDSVELDTANLADDSVTLAKLAPGITPSHVVVFSGKFTTVGGDAAEQASVAGVLATDIVQATLQTEGSSPVTLDAAAPDTDVINFTMSADPAADHIIAYTVLRAAS